MKLRLLPLTVLLLAGCSSGAISGEKTTLAPLPTTGVPTTVETLPGEDISYTREQYAFFDDVAYYYGNSPAIGDDEVLAIGELWCKLMTEGMTDVDVVARINEGAIDNDDAMLHLAIVLAGIENLCPSQTDKAEYIALNTPWWVHP